MLVCGCASLGAGVGADVGVGLCEIVRIMPVTRTTGAVRRSLQQVGTALQAAGNSGRCVNNCNCLDGRRACAQVSARAEYHVCPAFVGHVL